MRKVALLDTSAETANLGDHIIVKSLVRQIPELSGIPRAATHGWPNLRTRQVVAEAEHLVFAGTNVLTPKLYRRRQWPSLSVLQRQLKGKVWYAGIGWGAEAERLDRFTAGLIRRTMPAGSTIGVRDTLTYSRATASGLSSTYIGCPTMWGLNDELPNWDSTSEVVTTLTDYNRDPEADDSMLSELGLRFRKVFFWPQGANDLDYARTLPSMDRVSILPATVAAYDEAIVGRGHIGTRLHGGIRALQNGSPSFVFSVDHRALTISSDTGLPVARRGNCVKPILDAELSGSAGRILRIPRQEARLWIDDLRRSITTNGSGLQGLETP